MPDRASCARSRTRNTGSAARRASASTTCGPTRPWQRTSPPTADAADANRRVPRLNPTSTTGALALASVLLKRSRLAEARDTAAIVLTDARQPRDISAAHELLARIALAGDDAAAARTEAAAA